MASRIGDELKANALWFTALRTATLRTETVPPPGPGEIRVETIASAVSAGTELLVYRGEVPQDLRLDLPTFAGSYKLPIKYGYAAAGRVLDTGPDVERISPGNLNVVHDTPVRLGETALVFGQGVVGLLVALLLKRAGAGPVLIVDPLEERRKTALAAGADEAFGPERLKERVAEITGGRGADVAIETSGSGAALQGAIEAVATEGTVIVASWYGTKPVTLSLGGHFHRGRVRLRSSQVSRSNPELAPRWDRDRRMYTVIGLLSQLELKKLISHRIPFEEAPEAYPLLDKRPGEALQVIFTYKGIRGGRDV